MTGNSLENILAWMKNPENNVMLDWDCIAAISRDKTNTLLLQEYIARFSGSAYLKPISGEVEMVEGQWKEFVHDFILDAPRLSFENADLDSSAAKLTCAILGGMQLTMKYHVDVWLVDKIDEIDPLQGPKLFLDLNLARVEGIVESDGRFYLDLQYSDNFRLTFGSTEYEQRLGGDFFKALFNALPPEQRIWVMGRIQKGGNELLTPESFKLRTQSRGVESRDRLSPHHGDGAVLILIRMVGNPGGGDINPEYRYLIPDDADKDYSATVLFAGERMTSAYPIMDFAPELVAQLMGRKDFVYVRDAAGRVIKATVKSGELIIPPSGGEIPPWNGGGTPVKIHVYNNGIRFSGARADPLQTLQLNRQADGRVSISWEATEREYIVVTFPDSQYQGFVEVSDITVKVAGTYAYAEEGEDGFIIKPDLWISVTSESVDSLCSQSGAGDWFELLIYIARFIYALSSVTRTESTIKEALNKTLAVSVSLNEFIQDCIELNFGKAIVGDVIRVPRDIGFFGRINPTHTHFQISPLEPLMAAGGSQQFRTEPLVNRLTWTVEALPDQIGDIGDIDESSGLYQAPAASAIEGRFVRVRVTATEIASGYSSSALVTVLVNELTVNPLIQRCDAGGSVELKAGALGGGELDWEIKNPVEGESGRVEPSELPDGDRRYVAAPLVANKTYVLDEIEVTHTATGATKSAWVLAIQKELAFKVKPLAEQAPLPPDQLRLQAIFNGTHFSVEWSLPMGGPGSISLDSEGYGLYRADPQAVDRFVLIFAKLEGTPFGTLEGHIILPLPLDGFPAELELMKAAPGN
jgi:hypothetical protein